MSSVVTAQVPAGAIDTAGVSITTTTPTVQNARVGTIYNPSGLAAASPCWFHPMYDGRFLMVNSRTWTAATPGGGLGSYASYTESTQPSWLVVDGASGATSPVPQTPTVPFLSSPSSPVLTAAASHHPGYLFLLHSGSVGGTPQAILQHVSVATSGAVTLTAEEIVPKVTVGSQTVVFDRGIQLTNPYLILYGSDDTGTLYTMRKPWSKIGVTTTVMPSPQTHRSLGATQVEWDYYTGTGYSPDSTQLAPLTTVTGTSLTSVGPISLVMVNKQLILATVVENQGAYTAQVWSSKSGRPITPIGSPVALGSSVAYLGGGLGLQPNLGAVSVPSGAVTAVPYVVTTKVVSGADTSLQNTWGTLPISV